MQLYVRPEAKVKDSMESMSKQSTDMVLEYYEKTIKVSTYNINEGQLTRYNGEINDFVKEQKTLMDHLRNFKQHIK